VSKRIATKISQLLSSCEAGKRMLKKGEKRGRKSGKELWQLSYPTGISPKG